jgi:hypothetical protein
VCRDCGTVESPEWRKVRPRPRPRRSSTNTAHVQGPDGPKSLCNACGSSQSHIFVENIILTLRPQVSASPSSSRRATSSPRSSPRSRLERLIPSSPCTLPIYHDRPPSLYLCLAPTRVHFCLYPLLPPVRINFVTLRRARQSEKCRLDDRLVSSPPSIPSKAT